MWIRRVKEFARSGDNRAKGISNGLPYALMATLDALYRKLVESAVDSGELLLEQDKGESLLDVDQRRCIEKILILVAKDTDTDLVQRLLTLRRAVYYCKRYPAEGFSTYANRFRGIAQACLNQSRGANQQLDEQNFAMVLLENAGLEESTFNKIFSILGTKAEKRGVLNPRTVAIHTCKLHELKSLH